jgi:hypothetical protein
LCSNWAPRHEGILREWRYSSTHSLTLVLDGGEWSASRPGLLMPRERAPDTHWIGGWARPRAILDAVTKRKIPSPYRDSKPRSSSPWPSAIPLNYPSSCILFVSKQNKLIGWLRSMNQANEQLQTSYEGVTKSFRTGRLVRELQTVQLSAARCSCIAILWVSIVSFAAITLCGAYEPMFIVTVYFVVDSVRKFLIHPRNSWTRWMSFPRQIRHATQKVGGGGGG